MICSINSSECEASDFSTSFKKIQKLLALKEKENFKTTIIITMLDLNKKNQLAEYEKLRNAFKDLDVYIYLKSEDQQWYRKEYHGPTQSTGLRSANTHGCQ